MLDADERGVIFSPVFWSVGEKQGLENFPPLLGAVLPLQGQDLSFSVGESKDLFE